MEVECDLDSVGPADSISQTSSQTTVAPTSRVSKVWIGFEKLKKDLSKPKEQPVKCCLCRNCTLISNNGATSSMLAHLASKHPGWDSPQQRDLNTFFPALPREGLVTLSVP